MNTRISFSLFWQGYRDLIPLIVGVAPFGFVFGALAVHSGMTSVQALGMSVIVIAGSSQIVAAALIANSAPIPIIILATFVVNLRHFLYSATLESIFRPLAAGWKLLLAYTMIDEVFAIVIKKQTQDELSPSELRWYFLGGGFNLVSIWWSTTLAGAVVGNILPDKATDALGFTLPLTFISIVVPLVVKRPLLLAAISAGISGIILAPLPHKLGLIVATFIGIMVGVMSEKRITA